VERSYGAPQSVDEQIASLPELKYAQTNVGPVKVDVLGPDAAMRTFTARLEGTYKFPCLRHRHGAAGRPVEGQITAVQP